jgi:tRNA-specific 2-thiouridylase
MNGRVIGTHKGIYGYTIGQRKGMGIASPEPLYVADIDVLSNTLYVGPHDAAMRREIAVGDLNWIVPPVPAPDKGEVQSGSFKAHVKVRSAMKEAPATVFFKENTPLPPFAKGGAPGDIVRVAFDAPQWAPAPGQSAVFYEGDTVVGGGVINKRA